MLGLTDEDRAEYEAVRAEVAARLAAGELNPDVRKPIGGHHSNRRGRDEPSPGAEMLAEAVFDRHDVRSVVTATDAARAAGVAVETATRYIDELRCKGRWPYRACVAAVPVGPTVDRSAAAAARFAAFLPSLTSSFPLGSPLSVPRAAEAAGVPLSTASKFIRRLKESGEWPFAAGLPGKKGRGEAVHAIRMRA